MRSPNPEAFSPILSPVDFWLWGVTENSQHVDNNTNICMVLTLLLSLLSKSLAAGVRHVDLWW